MANKRQLARAALQAWKTKTTAEMFIEQHQGVHFAKTTKSPKVEIVNHNERYIDSVAREFASLSTRRTRCIIEPTFVGVYAHTLNSVSVITVEDDKSFENAIRSLEHSPTPRITPKEFDLDSYRGMTSNLNPLRC
ncbi:hypothetical protein [Acinetobacter courvalinii]|uniref:hypothetical protein n=1 Tax=Acinetobacter courvalinii TaxID=280147 RepID=UPI0019020117|nr:hypothetical protein [Acinetobacter courvalinii]MBJ9958411.1 hypothetical protein [Acinetobacter courvalinii]